MSTILVVDDEEIVLAFVRAALTMAGHSALTAESGHEALAICEARTDPIHMLLTDINMPRMNGIELAECLNTLQPGLPVVFMTGYATRTPQMDTLLTSGRFSSCAVIEKPFTSDKLVQEIERVLGNAEQRDQ